MLASTLWMIGIICMVVGLFKLQVGIAEYAVWKVSDK